MVEGFTYLHRHLCPAKLSPRSHRAGEGHSHEHGVLAGAPAPRVLRRSQGRSQTMKTATTLLRDSTWSAIVDQILSFGDILRRIRSKQGNVQEKAVASELTSNPAFCIGVITESNVTVPAFNASLSKSHLLWGWEQGKIQVKMPAPEHGIIEVLVDVIDVGTAAQFTVDDRNREQRDIGKVFISKAEVTLLFSQASNGSQHEAWKELTGERDHCAIVEVKGAVHLWQLQLIVAHAIADLLFARVSSKPHHIADD
uniref:Uncharacterized protein n=1 Tax=Palpitomonas bilix TaxID=652834 RepID=A0A7S3D0M0_9EUKA|mmetsp:Transcript_15149/g.38272  ORF Transcript_15149/g.38272 Transcript_15149/m.38272 type:complete len:254 (+) Transcript_15149:136-897(+)